MSLLNDKQTELLRKLKDQRHMRIGGRKHFGLLQSAKALERKGLVDSNDFGDYSINEAGRAALAEQEQPE